MSSPERCIATPESQAQNYSTFIEDFLNQTFQKENQPVFRCPAGVVPDVDFYDSAAEGNDGAAVAADQGDDKVESLDPRQQGYEFLTTHKSPTEIADKYAKDWMEGHYQFMTPFLQDIYDVARSSDDKAATLKKIQDRMNDLMKDDPKDTEVALDLRNDGTVLMRFGDSTKFYRHIIDLKAPFYQGNRFSHED
ncbi:MAG TPA: hypothetical protein EYN91_19535 [Candidatus Melainabacteria bacterium]|nr:hypothetical protein [Candidatus Melainabacteria bacterium]HIN62996.1 hypothetical protein [Candidatus Obscuribacterales bacterium]